MSDNLADSTARLEQLVAQIMKETDPVKYDEIGSEIWRQTEQKHTKPPYGWDVAIYPVMAWAPVFGTSVTLPPSPSKPITTPGRSGSTNSSINAAYFGGARFERNKWSADFLFMWAALSAHRETPHVRVNLDFVLVTSWHFDADFSRSIGSRAITSLRRKPCTTRFVCEFPDRFASSRLNPGMAVLLCLRPWGRAVGGGVDHGAASFGSPP